jgi:uracil-DNA glycosylase family 4
LRRLGVRYASASMGRSGVPTTESVVPSVTSEAPSAPPVTAPPMKPQAAPAPVSVAGNPLEAFGQKICECQKCPLGKTRKKFVFGSGNPKAQIVFVGEAPGADEDEQGLPFVGRAGQLLTKIIESTKTWKRDEVYICNVLKCRPPGNRPPIPEEVEACRPYLEEQLRILQPKLLVALGSSAAQALLKTKEPVGKLRGKWHDLGGIPLRVTYHPAALLRTDAYKKDVWEDMKVLTARFKELTGL